MIRITECPRDAMQGIKDWIPTAEKIDYLNSLLSVNFDVLDFGSFVSPKAIPQLKDTAQVLKGLNLEKTSTELLAIVANKRGAEDACTFEEIKYLGFPFSISEEFQKRNTNKTIDESLKSVEAITELCAKNNKECLIYISMAFGNPYGENWHPDIAIEWCQKLYEKVGVKHIALSDTIGVSDKTNITELFTEVLAELPEINFGAHLHTTPDTWLEKIEAAIKAGCTRFDGAIKGFGGCPMAKDELTGNMPTEQMVSYFNQNELDLNINRAQFLESMSQAEKIFSKYH